MNSRILQWIAVGLLICLWAESARAESLPITIAYLETGLKDLNDTDRQVALHLLASELAAGSDLNIEIRSLNNMDELLTLGRDGRVNYAILNSYFYLQEYERLMPLVKAEIWTIQRADAQLEDYVLVTNKKMVYQGMKSLQGKCLSLHSDYLLMTAYLESLLKTQASLGTTRFFKIIKNPKTVSQGVLDVYFNSCDVTIVPNYILDLVAELNPAVLEKVEVVHHSGAHFIPALALVFKNTPDTAADIIRSNLEKLSSYTRGQEILGLFKIKAINPINLEAVEAMRKFVTFDRAHSNKVSVLR